MAVNKVEVNGETKLDLTQDTVTPENLLSGATAHNAAGEQISGAVAPVRYDVAQNLTSEQKKQARDNIGAGDFATKNEAQGYVTAHNQSADAHADIRKALNGKEASGTAAAAVTAHNKDTAAHQDIRNALAGKEAAGAAATVQSNLTAHAGNTTVHVTAEQKTTWDGKAAKALSFTVTLTVAGWSGNAQTVSNSNFVASGYAYTVCPSSGSHEAYANAAIYADDVTAAGKMTFHCSERPTANLTVNILRVEVAA